MANTADKLPVRCHQCKKKFLDSNECGQHGANMGHVHRPSYYCPQPGCAMAFNKRQERVAHMESTGHKSSSIPAKLLPKASISNGLPPHLKAGTSPSLASAGAALQTVTCFACTPNRTFRDAAALADHRKTIHTMATPAAPHGASATPATSQPKDTGTTAPIGTAAYHCAKCNYDFSTESALQTHYNESVVHPHCRTCGLGFESIVPFVTHKRGCPPPGTYTANGVPANQKDEPATAQANNHARSGVPATASPGALSSEEPEIAANITRSPMSQVPSGRHSTGVSEAASVVSSRAAIPTAARSSSTPTGLPTDLAGGLPNGLVGEPARNGASHVPPWSQSTAVSAYGADEEEAERVYRALQGHHAEPAPTQARQAVNGKAPERSHSPSGWSSSTRGIPMPPPRTASPSSQRYTPQRAMPVQAAAPTQARLQTLRSVPARTARAPAPSTPTGMSFHCRACLNDPVEPVTTMCGHLFCHSCIVQEIATRMCCPVCQEVFLVRLHLDGC
ncbi:hypothetical protein C8Q80DRAFT_753712 [Daedaleopsis nitida]|nr:hypothetical protein C8Q80DRAFT_753712 [Daedaleopsis nitida]